MGQKLPPDQLELYKRLDEILFYKWDPIGISGMDWSRDEYRTYLPKVFRLALDSESTEPLVDYLTQVEREGMGLRANTRRNREIAELIIALKERLIE